VADWLQPLFSIGTAAVGAAAALIGLTIYSLTQRAARLRAQRVITEHRDQIELISAMGHLGFCSWNAATGHLSASANARRIFGIAAEQELSFQTCLGAIHPDDRTRISDAIRQDVWSDPEIELEFRLAVPNNDTHWVSGKARRYTNAQGGVKRVAGFVIDDGPLKRATSDPASLQEKLTHLTRVALLGELSGALAHELQQPLTATLANAQAAQFLSSKGQINVLELKEILQSIVSETKNAGQIIQRLRALLVRGETAFQPVAVEDLLAEVLTLARGTLMERNVQVTTRLAGTIPAIKGDPVELKQVLLNLVLNACESMRLNPTRDRRVEIVVGMSTDGRAVCTSVLDCGRGIEGTQLQRVFEPFFTTKDGGLGLGLSISHSIVVAHGGRLWATNRSDRGAAFHFTLPIAA
jgi:C4-dicarboxylate-specific signal transduction histidine kinase